MEYPNTPRTIFSRLKRPDETFLWHSAWRDFFDLYHAPIKVMVAASFSRRGWYNLPLHVQDEIISDVILSLDKVFREDTYEKVRSKFRHFLKTIVERRVLDYMRRYYASRSDKSVSIDALENAPGGTAQAAFGEPVVALDENEELAFRRAAILDCYESIRGKFEPQYCLAFEMVKFEGKKVGDVVDALGINAATVSSAIYRITKALRAAVLENLKEEFGHEEIH